MVRQQRRVLAFGPLRYRRQAMAVFYPLCLIVPAAAVGEFRITGLAVAMAFSGIFVFLARAMKVECRDTELRIRNMFTSHSIPLHDIAQVGLSRPFAPGYTAIIEVETTSSRIYPAAGVSVWSDSLTMKRRFSTRRSLAAIERARTFFRECGLEFRSPPG